ncbi:AsmA-like C-terminal region-containing protein [Denitromonas halophila]|uniref:Uncharacterized protein n=1 Tax=Denitromonas halophila TaxID=1629404 RepID=A0A557QK87_9RHOO|nr:AsmA-like C-terminal region-containing protein [Denitromonas halophila]TVO53297.1 hypothetical protein FHP91_16045 [Denitromonas halophila]
MNFEDTVYVKTELGDARAKQPRSISSHELRATLLLIDGRITVREMKRRFGSSLAIDPAVSELLREGLIRAKSTATDAPAATLTAEQDPDDEAAESLLVVVEAPPEAPEVEVIDVAEVETDDVAAGAGAQSVKDERIEPEGEIPAHDEPLDPNGAQEPMVGESERDKPITDEPPPALVVSPRLGDSTRGGMIALGFFVERLWRGLLPIAAFLLIGALVVAAFLLPERYRADVESAMSTQLGTSVRFGGLRASFAGGGSLQLSDVRVEAIPSLRASEVYLIPDWPASLRAVDWRVTVKITELRGTPSAFARVLAMPARSSAVVETLFERLSVTAGGEQWALLSGSVTHDQNGATATLRDALGGLSVTATGDGDALRVDAVAVNQVLPVFSQIPFNTMQVVGRLSDEGFDVGSFGASALDGKLSGSAKLVWEDNTRMTAEVALSQINAEGLLKRLGSSVRLSGSVSGAFTLGGVAAHPSEIRYASSVNGRFDIANGALGGIDLGAAMRERGSGKIQGGETRFETMSGTLTRKAESLEVQVSRLEAGALEASGTFKIGALESLSGVLTTVVGRGDRRVRLPVDIGGSLAAPTLEARLPPPVVEAPPAPAVGVDAFEASLGQETPGGSLEVPVVPGSLR